MDPEFEPKHGTFAKKTDRRLLFLSNTEGMVHVCHVPSPAVTALLAIGKYI
jgi:hypothetical protein